MTYKIVEVEWIDAASKRNVTLSEIKNAPTTAHTLVVKSVGYLIKEDEQGIVIAQDINGDGGCDIVAIPNNFKPKVIELRESEE